jgi:hypothetical protein
MKLPINAACLALSVTKQSALAWLKEKWMQKQEWGHGVGFL